MEEQALQEPYQLLTPDFLLSWLTDLPPLLYVLLAAGLILAAVTFGLSRSAQMQSERRREQARARAEERGFALRRDIYPAAAGALARAQEHLARLPNINLSGEHGQAVQDAIAGALGQVQLVGSEAAIRATSAVATELQAGMLQLLARRRPLTELENEIEALDGKISHLSYERDQLMASITRLAGDGLEQHAALWGDMNLRFDKLHREIAGLLSLRSEKQAALARMKHEYSTDAAQAALKIARLSVTACLTLRNELGLVIDESEFRAMAQRNIAEIERHLRQLSPASEAPKGDAEAHRKSAAGEGKANEQPHETKLRMVLKRG